MGTIAISLELRFNTTIKCGIPLTKFEEPWPIAKQESALLLNCKLSQTNPHTHPHPPQKKKKKKIYPLLLGRYSTH